MKLTRRDFLKATGAAGVVVVAGIPIAKAITETQKVDAYQHFNTVTYVGNGQTDGPKVVIISQK